MITINCNPIGIIVDIFNQKYPDKEVSINLVQELYEKTKAYGETFWPDDGSKPIISIDVSTPFIGFIEVLAHELAHVVAGHDAGHGKKWDDEFTMINEEFNKRITN